MLRALENGGKVKRVVAVGAGVLISICGLIGAISSSYSSSVSIEFKNWLGE